jgi:hypothetical protein
MVKPVLVACSQTRWQSSFQSGTMTRPTMRAVTLAGVGGEHRGCGALRQRAGGDGVVDEQDAMGIDPERRRDYVIAGGVVADLGPGSRTSAGG